MSDLRSTGPWGEGRISIQSAPLSAVPEWQVFARENAEATAEIFDMLAHGRIVSAHHVDRLVSEEDMVWPRLYTAIRAARTKSPDRVKLAAYRLTRNALKQGVLVRQPCEICGEEPAEAHHDDYTQPLNVHWLCVPHHRQHHNYRKPAKRRLAA